MAQRLRLSQPKASKVTWGCSSNTSVEAQGLAPIPTFFPGKLSGREIQVEQLALKPTMDACIGGLTAASQRQPRGIHY